MVSIIVPIYNSEKYLRKTLDSIYNQSYKDFEVILVNDGSKDKSLQICEEYKLKNKNTKLISLKNSGVSNARNEGLKNTKGEYICFLDSDDIIDKNYLDEMVKLIRNSDIGVCSYEVIKYKNNETKIIKAMNNKTIDEILITLILNELLNPLWNKIYRTELIKKYNIKFDKDINLGEDLLFNLKYLSHCHDVSTTNLVLYQYYLRSSGLNSNNGMSYVDNLKRIERTHKITLKDILHNDNNIDYLVTFIYKCNLIDYKYITKYKEKNLRSKSQYVKTNSFHVEYWKAIDTIINSKNATRFEKFVMILLKNNEIFISHFLLRYLMRILRRNYNE